MILVGRTYLCDSSAPYASPFPLTHPPYTYPLRIPLLSLYTSVPRSPPSLLTASLFVPFLLRAAIALSCPYLPFTTPSAAKLSYIFITNSIQYFVPTLVALVRLATLLRETLRDLLARILT
ncbi:hypothetical protein C8R47DRAFT_661637 [Mycena vitilis]|nr:hypothetical protein C8R47DRAFT_661637 [Mycena vitilis]